MTNPYGNQNGNPGGPAGPNGNGEQHGGAYAQGYGQMPGYQYPGYYAPPTAYPQQNNNSFLPVSPERFIKGALIGAAAAYILTNPRVQNAVIKGSVRAWNMMQGGIEEVKERFRDAEAEIQAEKAAEE